MSDKLSIVIPTYNRPELLRATLGFLQAGTRLPIIVADGSETSVARANKEICHAMGENISYFERPNTDTSTAPIDNVVRRLQAAFASVATPYVVCCADDDLLVVESALTGVDFLEANDDYIGCQGVSLGFRYEPFGLRVEHLEYSDASIDGRDASARLMQLFSRYEFPFYCVFRTPVQRWIFDNVRWSTSPHFFEIFHTTAAVVAGKLKRIDEVYYLRNVETTAMSATAHSENKETPSAGWI